MALNARKALNRLVAALEHHLDLAENSDVVDPPVLERAEDMVRDAFFTYDDALFTGYGAELPFEILDDDFEEDDDEDDDDDSVDVFGDDHDDIEYEYLDGDDDDDDEDDDDDGDFDDDEDEDD